VPIFGNNAASVGSGGLATVDLYGHFDPAFIPAQGNPVPGGTLVSSHVRMEGPAFGQPDATVQLAVYDTLFMLAPNLWTVLAISAPFLLPAASPVAWHVTPIVGVLMPGNSYATAVLSVHAGTSPQIHFSALGNGGASKAFIAPGVFPDPLGGVAFPRPYWLIYTTYNETNAYTPTAACACSDS